MTVDSKRIQEIKDKFNDEFYAISDSVHGIFIELIASYENQDELLQLSLANVDRLNEENASVLVCNKTQNDYIHRLKKELEQAQAELAEVQNDATYHATLANSATGELSDAQVELADLRKQLAEAEDDAQIAVLEKSLKECPFCDSENINWGKGKHYTYRCKNCGAVGPFSQHLEYAIEKWNTRRCEERAHATLRKQLAEAKAELEGAHNILTERNEYIEKLEPQLAEAQAEIERLQTKLDGFGSFCKFYTGLDA